MNKQTKKTNKTGRIALLIIVLAIILALLNPAVLTFLPLGIREYLAQFSATYFSKSIVSGITLEAVAAAVLAMVITWLAGDLVKNLTESFHSQRHRSETIRHLIGSILKYTIYIVGFVVALGCLGVDAAAMFVSAGVVGIVVGFGAQSLIEDVITGLFIIFEGEFEVGDIITIDGFRGEVKSIGLRTVSIIDRGGNIRIINNSEISSLINLSEVNSVAVVTVPVSYEDKLLDVEAAVKEALSELPSEYPEIFKSAPVYKGVDKLVETHIELMVVATVKEEDIYNARRIMHREIRLAFEKAGLSVPFKE